MTNKSETSKSCTFRLDADTITDILAMAKDVAGKPGNVTAGLCALVVEWRRLKAAEIAGQKQAEHALSQIVKHEEYLAALDRRAEAEGG